MNWYIKANLRSFSYDRDMAFLRDYLQKEIDPWDFPWHAGDYLEEQGEELPDDFDAIEWVENASPEQLEAFKEHLVDFFSIHPPEDGTTTPAYQHFDFTRIQEPGWLVHFTSDAFSVASKGFKFGHEEMEGLGLTTWKGESSRQKYAGFNFAFDADSRQATMAARSNKYGKEAVVFWGSGVLAYHYGDEENQVIFWGQSVNISMIFPIFQADGEWIVQAENGREMKRGEFNDVVNWVENNYRMLQQIEKKLHFTRREEVKRLEKWKEENLSRSSQ